MKSILRKLTIDNAILLLVLCMLGWAGNTIAGRLSSDEISPMVIVFLRWAIVSSILLILKYQKINSIMVNSQNSNSLLIGMASGGVFRSLDNIQAWYVFSNFIGV